MTTIIRVGGGTGAVTVISQIANKRKILTAGLVTILFLFESSLKINHAEKGIVGLREVTDILVVNLIMAMNFIQRRRLNEKR